MVKAAGERGSWALIGGLALLVLARPTGCDKGDGGDTALDAATDAVLADLGPEVVLPALDTFLSASAALGAATTAWSAAPQDDAAQRAAQAAWLDAMLAWQVLEVMQVGPAASSLSDLGGEDRRDAVYSWPTVNPCAVDQVTVEGGWEQADFFTVNLVNVYGLDALEHLLYSGPDNACPGQVDINTDGTWDALGAEGVASQRASYAAALAAELQRQGQALRDRWAPEGGDFSALVRALDPASPYEDPQTALNAVFDAMFYLELVTKDRKLGQPLGLQDCGTTTCPDDAEHLPSGAGVRAVEANLRGFQAVFTGNAGAGLDELLAAQGREDITQTLTADLDAALAQAQALSGGLDTLITEDPEPVQALYDAVKRVTDTLKGDLATVLRLQIPAEAAGDND